MDAGSARWRLQGLSPPPSLSTLSLRSFARRNCARVGVAEGDADDIVQEALFALHLNRHIWDSNRSVGPWIMTITRNKLIDVHRKQSSRCEAPIELADKLCVDGEVVLGNRCDLTRMLNGLEQRERDLVRSLLLEGHSAKETATRLNKSEGAVRVALHRAVKSLSSRRL